MMHYLILTSSNPPSSTNHPSFDSTSQNCTTTVLDQKGPIRSWRLSPRRSPISPTPLSTLRVVLSHHPQPIPNRENTNPSLSPVWASLITNTRYLPGLLTLHYALRKHGSKYPLIALYTSTFPTSGHAALDGRNIPKKHVEYLVPSVQRDFTNSDPRFYDTWSKLTLFSLTEFERVVLLDCDMLVLRNMDELMEDVELDHPALEGKGQKVFAAAHACVCNPLRRTHYPVDW